MKIVNKILNMLSDDIKTPCYIIDENKLIDNLNTLHRVEERTGAKILLAQKAFSCYALYPLIGKYLSGTTASSLFEARLGHDEMGGETHIYAPVYRAEDFYEIAELCGHIVFNSVAEYYRYCVPSRIYNVKCGLRINPEYSEIETELYDPCAPASRMGVRAEDLKYNMPSGISGLHFHTMCEQNSDTLWRTVLEVDKKFGDILARPEITWINFGGGHHITRADYDMEALDKSIAFMRDKYDLEVYLEPGEAVALDAGCYLTQVLDVIENGKKIAIVDGSAACHMPDVLEMPYQPPLMGGGLPGEKLYDYRIAGSSCLAGDVIGDYSYGVSLMRGDILVFKDMAIYTMVKNNTFNGINLPCIYIRDRNGKLRLYKEFGYDDFKSRL